MRECDNDQPQSETGRYQATMSSTFSKMQKNKMQVFYMLLHWTVDKLLLIPVILSRVEGVCGY